MTHALRLRTATALVFAFGIVAGASAAPAPEGRPAMFSRLTDCRKLTDNTQRLACYDAATGDLDQAEAKGDIVVVDRDQARKVRRQAFGFAMPSLALFEKGESKEELENVTGTLASARQDGNGKWTVRLEDGAVWRQIDTSMLILTPKPGMPVTIKKASLGSFLLSINGKHGFRAQRVE